MTTPDYRAAIRERLAAIFDSHEGHYADAAMAVIEEWLHSPEVLELLAAIEHERWSNWMAYQRVAPPERVADWPRKERTPYSELTEAEKESDRVEARKTLAALHEAAGLPAPGGESGAYSAPPSAPSKGTLPESTGAASPPVRWRCETCGEQWDKYVERHVGPCPGPVVQEKA